MGNGRRVHVDADRTIVVGTERLRAGELLGCYQEALADRELATGTVERYLRAVRQLLAFLAERDLPLAKPALVAFKEELVRTAAPSTTNVSIEAVNGLLRMLGHPELCLRRLRVQPPDSRPPERELTREEYKRLLRAARDAGDERMCLAIQTICATGIRVSELAFVTVAATREGGFVVRNKGKSRAVYLPGRLARRLRTYATRLRLREGPVFVGRGGTPLDRMWIWRKMKEYGAAAGVDARKVYPHNLRHLFALAYYHATKGDIDGLSHTPGHSRVETTRVYLVEDEGRRRRHIDRLNLLL